MRVRFLKKCKCEDDGYVKLQETETADKIRYFELTVNCRECGRAYREVSPKGPFRGKVLYTDAKPEKKKVKKEKIVAVDSAAPEKDISPEVESFGKKMARLKREKKEKKDLSGVTFDKDRN